MAETISFSGGSFTQGIIDIPGTNDVVVNEAPDGGFVLRAQDGTAIVNLGLQGDDEAQNLFFETDTNTAVAGLEANLGGGDDTLIIGGKTLSSDVRLQSGDDTILGDGTARDSEIRTNAGNDDAAFNSESQFVARDSLIAMGKGNDTLVFGGGVQNIQSNLGTGSDTLEFQGNIAGANVNLGGNGDVPDGEVDTIRINGDADIQGLVITGADENDVLFIGTTQFNFDSANNLWVNSNDPNDTRNFS